MKTKNQNMFLGLFSYHFRSAAASGTESQTDQGVKKCV
jgi:hypothetical protein